MAKQVYGNSKCSGGGPVCQSKDKGRNKRYLRPHNQKGR